jgi:hypothetical protein
VLVALLLERSRSRQTDPAGRVTRQCSAQSAPLQVSLSLATLQPVCSRHSGVYTDNACQTVRHSSTWCHAHVTNSQCEHQGGHTQGSRHGNALHWRFSCPEPKPCAHRVKMFLANGAMTASVRIEKAGDIRKEEFRIRQRGGRAAKRARGLGRQGRAPSPA